MLILIQLLVVNLLIKDTYTLVLGVTQPQDALMSCQCHHGLFGGHSVPNHGANANAD